jgi:anti-sigma B factor antagonist
LVPCDLDGVAVIRPVGSIDAAAAPVLESHFQSFLEKNTTKIVIDFSKADFISSAGIGILLGTVSLLRESEGDLIFMNVPSHVSSVFEIINLTSFFVIIDNLYEIEPARTQD